MKKSNNHNNLAFGEYDPRFGHNDPMKSLLRRMVPEIRQQAEIRRQAATKTEDHTITPSAIHHGANKAPHQK